MAEGKGYAYYFALREHLQIPDLPEGNPDEKHFKNIFVDKLGFDQKFDRSTENFTRRDWNHKLEEPRDKKDHSEGVGPCCLVCHMRTLDFSHVDYLMVGISSHDTVLDNNDDILLPNGERLLVEEVMFDLNDVNMPNLIGKKRILVFDKCRQNSINKGNEDFGQQVSSDQGTGSNFMVAESISPETKQVAGHSGTGPGRQQEKIVTKDTGNAQACAGRFPTNICQTQPQDFLVLYSTTWGRYTHYDNFQGSDFLRLLAEAMNEHDSNIPLNFFHIITKTAEKMTCLPDKEKQICCVSSTLQTLPIFP